MLSSRLVPQCKGAKVIRGREEMCRIHEKAGALPPPEGGARMDFCQSPDELSAVGLVVHSDHLVSAWHLLTQYSGASENIHT